MTKAWNFNGRSESLPPSWATVKKSTASDPSHFQHLGFCHLMLQYSKQCFLSVYPCEFYLTDNLKYRSLENIFGEKMTHLMLWDARTRWSDTMNVCLLPWGGLWPSCKKCVFIIRGQILTPSVLLWTQLTSMQYKLLKSVPRGFISGIIPLNAWLPVTRGKFIWELKTWG